MASRRRGPSTRLQLNLRTEWDVADEATFVIPMTAVVLGQLPRDVGFEQLELKVVVNGTAVLDTKASRSDDQDDYPFDASMMASCGIPVPHGYRGSLNVSVVAFAPPSDAGGDEWSVAAHAALTINRPATATPTPASVSDPTPSNLRLELLGVPAEAIKLARGQSPDPVRIGVVLHGDHLQPKDVKRTQLGYWCPTNAAIRQDCVVAFASGVRHAHMDVTLPADSEGTFTIEIIAYVGREQAPVTKEISIMVEREAEQPAPPPQSPTNVSAKLRVMRVPSVVEGDELVVSLQLELNGEHLPGSGEVSAIVQAINAVGIQDARLRPWQPDDPFRAMKATIRVPARVPEGEVELIGLVDVPGFGRVEAQASFTFTRDPRPAPPPDPEPTVLDDNDLEDISDLTSPPEQAAVVMSLIAVGTESSPGLPPLPPSGYVLDVHLEETGSGRALAEGILDVVVREAVWNGLTQSWDELEGEGSVRTLRVPGTIPLNFEPGRSYRVMIPAYAGADFGPQYVIKLPTGTHSNIVHFECGSFRRSGGGAARGARAAARGFGRFAGLAVRSMRRAAASLVEDPASMT